MFETVQSKLVFGATLLILLLNVIFGYMSRSTYFGTVNLFMVLLIGVPLALLFAYDINCLVVGNCTIWSWIRTVIYLLMVIFSVMTVVLAVLMFKKIKKEEESKKSEET